MAAIYSNGGNRWNILGFNFTKRDALSSVYKISMVARRGGALCKALYPQGSPIPRVERLRHLLTEMPFTHQHVSTSYIGFRCLTMIPGKGSYGLLALARKVLPQTLVGGSVHIPVVG
jgi:hypothetical protein